MLEHSVLKRLLPLLLILFFAIRPVSGQDGTLIVSERVGPEIDFVEREYFGLFPEIHSFASASFSSSDMDEVAVTLRRTMLPDSLLYVDRLVFDELGRYLDRFESIYADTRAANWGLLYQVARPIRHVGKGIPLTVSTLKGDAVSGYLLYLDEKVLVLTAEQNVARQVKDISKMTILFPDQIMQIEDGLPKLRRITAGVHILLAGRKEIYLTYALPKLKDKSTLLSTPSPALNDLLEQTTAARSPGDAGGAEVDVTAEERAYAARTTPRWHFGAAVQPLAFGYVPERYTVRIFSQEWDQLQLKSEPVNLSFLVRYALSERVLAGIGLQTSLSTSSLKPPEGTTTAENEAEAQHMGIAAAAYPGFVSMSGQQLDATISYVLKPYDRLAYLRGQHTGAGTPFEIRAAIGPALGILNVRSGLGTAYIMGTTVVRYGSTSSYRQVVLGGITRLEIDFFFTRQTSVGIRTHVAYYPGVEVRDHELMSPTGSRAVRTLQGRRQAMATGSVSLSWSLHL